MQAFYAAGSRTPNRRIAYDQTAGERVLSGLKQGVECKALTRKRMWRCCQVDLLIPSLGGYSLSFCSCAITSH